MLFISHSSKDLSIVSPLVNLIRSALAITPDQIRCSSLNGYRLPGGANVSETLKREVGEAQTFVGLLSYNSIQSTYVTFELGARWGANKHFIPLIAPGVGSDILDGPLAEFNSLSCESAGQLHQFVKELSEQLQVQLFPANVYQQELEIILALPKAPKQIIPQYISSFLEVDYSQRQEKLTKSQKEILGYLVSESKSRASVSQKELESKFNGRYDSIYWRLEALCYLGFTEKEVTGNQGGITTFSYRLTKEYKANL